MSMRVVVLGATRGMGREVARRLAERGDHLVLLGRKQADLDAAQADLEGRGAAEVVTRVFDLADADAFEPAIDAAASALGTLDAVVVTASLFGTQEDLEADLGVTAQLLDVNFTKTILFCEVARTRLMEMGGGSLVVFSSVAGDRGRRSNGLYSATKAGLSHYLEALDHRFHDQGLHTLCVKPGFIRTGMTEGLDEPPFTGEPDEVSRLVVAAMDRKAPMVYAPRIWQLVMLVISFLPRFVMRRVGF